MRYGDQPDKPSGSAVQAEIKRLKTELRLVTEERDILKKAMAFFGNDHRGSTTLLKRIGMSFRCVLCFVC